MIDKIIHQARTFEWIVADLKKSSMYYPAVILRYYKNPNQESTIGLTDCYASTLVRIERDGIWYTVHCVECCTLTSEYDETKLLLKFMDSVYKIQHCYQIQTITTPNGKPLQDVDPMQKSEKERVRALCDM